MPVPPAPEGQTERAASRRASALAAGVAAAAAVTRARVTAAVLGAGVDPQLLVDRDPAHLHGGDGLGDGAGTVVHTLDVRGRVVDEPAGHLLAELRVLAGVQDEGVPADVHHRRRGVGLALAGRDQLQEGQRLVDDALGERAVQLLVLDDAADESAPELVVDHGAVGQFLARLLLDGERHVVLL